MQIKNQLYKSLRDKVMQVSNINSPLVMEEWKQNEKFNGVLGGWFTDSEQNNRQIC